jgi:predicted DsbA family dithiol-disulfide isomerase
MRSAIESNQREAEEHMVLGVPTLIFGGFPVHGCQSIETMRTIMERALSRLQKQ